MDWKWRTATLLSPITTIPREYVFVAKALGLAISWQLLLLVCVLYLERVASFGEILCQNVQHPDHLRKYEHSVSSFPQPGQQFVKQNQFPTGLHQTLEHRSDFQQRTMKEKENSEAQPHVGVFIFSSVQHHNSTFISLGSAGSQTGKMYLEVVLLCFSLSLLRVFNEETVVAALFQLHNNVQEARGAASGAFGESFVIPGQNPPGDIEEQIQFKEQRY